MCTCFIFKNSVWQRASSANYADVVATLIKHGKADPQIRSPKTGWVALHEAAMKGNAECIKVCFCFVCLLLFNIPLKNISLNWRFHHCHWMASKFRPMLITYNLWAGRDLYSAIPAMTQGLGFWGLIQKTTPNYMLSLTSKGYWGHILTQMSIGQIYSLLIGPIFVIIWEGNDLYIMQHQSNYAYFAVRIDKKKI